MARRVTAPLVVLSVSVAVLCRTLPEQPEEFQLPNNEEISFMRRYGYLPEADGPDTQLSFTAQAVAEAVRRAQAFAGLSPTGVMDEATRKLFKKRRCGVKDIIDNASGRRKRYALEKPWQKNFITYKVVNGASTLDVGEVRRQTAAALALWAPHSPLRFAEADTKPDIHISFVTGDHGDGSPFDGRGGALGHAFKPPSGTVHFDDAELWGASEDDADDYTDYFAAATHELGHALGLGHSNVTTSVMYPYYQVPIEKLDRDDVLAMKELYFGETEISILPDSSEPLHVDYDDPPDICYTNYDTVQVINSKIYLFEEDWVWVLSEKRVLEAGWPRRLQAALGGLPSRVTHVPAIYQDLRGQIVVFSGREVFLFDEHFNLTETRDLTHYALPPYIFEVTTVFLSNYNNKTYLVYYDRFWRFDEATGTMDVGYPKSMEAWRGVPSPVDAAFVWQGDTYFFRGPRFYRFDNTLVAASDRYPLPVAPIWLPCPLLPEHQAYTKEDW